MTNAKTSANELVSPLAYLTTKQPQFEDPTAPVEEELVGVKASTEPANNVSPPSPFAKQSLTNVCSANAGARVLFATDEWFATADNLLEDGPPVFVDDFYCEQGKVMDGWESRRRREAGHDWCLIKLSSRQAIVGVEIDTAHFTGNHVPHISLQVADLVCSQQETAMVSGLPGVLERLLNHGRGIQGSGHHTEEVQQAERACAKVEWSELLPMTSLQPGYEHTRMHYFTLPTPVFGTHVRVNYYPDGGVSRLRLWSSPMDDTESSSSRKTKPLYSPIQTGKTCTVVSHSSTDAPPSQQPYKFKELSAAKNGGVGLAVSNKHYGEPWNLIQDTLGKDMGDGWETARHPDRPAIWVRDRKTQLLESPLMDWAVLKLGSMASEGIARIILDTRHFKGNYPESVLVEGCCAERGVTDDMVCSADESSVKWFPLLPRTRMAPDSEHVFDCELNQIANATEAVTHVRVSIYPDGGISRVRVYGSNLTIVTMGCLNERVDTALVVMG